MTELSDVLELRNARDDVAAELNVTVGAEAEEAYEAAASSDELQQAGAVVADQISDLDELAAVRADAKDLAAELGVEIGYPLDSVTSSLAFAKDQRGELRRLRTNYERLNQGAAAIDLEAPSFASMNAARVAGDLNFEVEQQLVDTHFETLVVLAAATDEVNSSRSLTQTIGLWGKSGALADAIAEARGAFSRGDNDQSRAEAARVEDLLATASSAGRTRIIVTAVTMFLVGLAATLFLRRRHKNSAGKEAT